MAKGMTCQLLDGLRALAAASEPWQGTATDLLALLPPDGRPADSTRLGGVLRSATRALAEMGIEVTARREAGTGRRLYAVTADHCGVTVPENRQGQAALQAARVPQPTAEAPPLWPGYGTPADDARVWFEAMKPTRRV